MVSQRVKSLQSTRSWTVCQWEVRTGICSSSSCDPVAMVMGTCISRFISHCHLWESLLALGRAFHFSCSVREKRLILKLDTSKFSASVFIVLFVTLAFYIGVVGCCQLYSCTLNHCISSSSSSTATALAFCRPYAKSHLAALATANFDQRPSLLWLP